MSTNKTENYGLHAWEPGDDFMRTEFNENFQKLDAALAGLQSSLGNKLEIVTGSYTGNDAATRTITLGFRPKLVIVVTRDGLTYTGYDVHCQAGGFFTPNMTTVPFTFTDSGFTVKQTSGNYSMTSDSKDVNPFYYIAFR